MTRHPRRRSLLALATLAALAQPLLTPTASAATSAASASAGTPAAAASAPAAPITAQSPQGWIVYDDATYTPVLDDVSQALADVRTALARKDNAAAASAMERAAQALQAQGDRLGRIDRARAAADLRLARDTHLRLNQLQAEMDHAAALIRAGKLSSTAALDKTLGRAARADLDRRWLVTDVRTWYPVSEEPQRHFAAALEDLARKDTRGAASQVRKADAYVRLEAGRAASDMRAALHAADRELQSLASALDRGTATSAQTLKAAFARSEQALALSHRAKAAEAWSRKAFDDAGYELKAAAHGLQSAAAWAGPEAAAGAAGAVADARGLGDKLSAGGVWAQDEVAKGLESLGHALAALGKAIAHTKAPPHRAPT